MKYNRLIKLIEQGIVRKPPKAPGSFKGAFKSGAYIGCPGKDIFLSFKDLTEDEVRKTAIALANTFPKEAPGNHVGTAACIRYVFGEFEKQGTLRSKKDYKRMSKEDLHTKWVLPRLFMEHFKNKLENKKKYYGLTISYEMEAHRLGDNALLDKNRKMLDEMVVAYQKSVEFAYECKSYKQMFTPYYWASCYLIKFGDKERAISFCKTTLKQAEKHCPDARGSYVDKLCVCLKYLRKNDPGWKKWFNKFKSRAKNKCVKKAIRKF